MNKNIIEMDLYTAVKAGYFLHMWNTDLSDSQKLDLKELLSSQQSQNFEWIPDPVDDYDEFDVVTYHGIWYQSTIDNNEFVPGTNPDNTDPLPWIVINKAPSGSRWQAGVFPYDDAFVVYTLGGATSWYYLKNATRPFVSTDFETELSNGDWEAFVGGELNAAVDVDLSSYELLFNNKLGIFAQSITQSGPLTFTLAAAGNIPCCVIQIPVTSDGVNPFFFPSEVDFLYGLNNGDALPAGDYEFFFLYKNGTISCSVPIPNIVSIPFFSVFERGTPTDNELLSDSDITGWHCKAVVEGFIPAGSDGFIEAVIDSAMTYIMIGLNTDSANGDYSDYPDKAWCNSPDYYSIFGGGGAADSGFNAADGDIFRFARVGSDFVVSYFRASVETIIASGPAVMGDLYRHVWIYTPSITVGVNKG